MKKVIKEIVEACQYCPKRVGGWSETHCLECKPARVIKGQYLEGFPDWCPLEDYKEDNENGKEENEEDNT